MAQISFTLYTSVKEDEEIKKGLLDASSHNRKYITGKEYSQILWLMPEM